MKAEPEVPAGHPDQFPETRWTLVLAARSDPAKRRSALEALVQPRWRALYAEARARGLLPADAEDYLTWVAVLDAWRSSRPLRREPVLWVAVAISLLPPLIAGFGIVNGIAP